MPERLQQHMLPIELVAAIDPLMNDTPVRAAMIENFQALEKILGAGSPAGRVAAIISEELA
jgi:lipid A disaccharide synthetase